MMQLKINQSNFIYLQIYINKARQFVNMILELRKSCLEAIERALNNINQIRTSWASAFPKPAQQKLHSVQNDIQLLKDNFTLIATKVLRLESKCSEKESMAIKAEHKYRMKFQQACESYKILEVKHQKLGKQLNFIKFSNNSLRNQLQSLQKKQNLNQRLSKAIIEIERLISSNGENLQNNINKIIASVQKQLDSSANSIQKVVLADIPVSNQQILQVAHRRVGSACQFSLQPPPIKHEAMLKQQKLIINSCELKNQKQHLKTKKKCPSNKESEQHKQSLSTDKKKRNQLAKLIDQQSRLARINQRYLSTDIF